jgi:protein-L-isoaspartate(D-aspartate) O-methyltransferase
MMKKFYRSSVLFLAAIAVCVSCKGGHEPLAKRRADMVKEQLLWRGITDKAVIRAFEAVPREHFILPQYRDRSYDDIEAPIAFGETLDRPYENARMLQSLELKPTDKVLEIGTGTGYVSALMSKVVQQVYTIEIEPTYADEARKNFAALGYKNIEVKTGDGFLGWPEHAPFDAILMVCSPPHIPKPLEEQLAEGGRFLLPLGGDEKFQELVLFMKKDGKLVEQRRLSHTEFAPMKGIIREEGR